MLHISDEAVEEMLNWGGGPQPAPTIKEQWEKLFDDWNKEKLRPVLSGKKSDKTSKRKYCGGSAYWMKTSKGYRLVDFFNRAHQCENYKLGKVQ